MSVTSRGVNGDGGWQGTETSHEVSVCYRCVLVPRVPESTYVVFELPIVLALKKLKNFRELIVVCLLLGLTEAGFFPSPSLYISMVYKREEQGLRLAYLFASVSLAGMFGGLLGTAITKIGDSGGLRAWIWLYVIEGCVSVLVVAWAFFGLPNDPSQANFFTSEEKDVMHIRDLQRQEYLGSQIFKWKEVFNALKYPKVHITQVTHHLQRASFAGVCSANSLTAQYLSVPVYFLGGVSLLSAADHGCWSAAILGDKWKLRGTLLLILDVFAVIGYALLLGVSNNAGVRCFACYLIALPLYCGSGLNEIWINNNMAPHYRRATAIGLQQTIGNIAGIVAPQVYRGAPYRLGHWCSLASAIICIILISGQIAYLCMMNAKKDAIANGKRPDDRKETTGEGHLEFRHIY
ncbi:MFS general substrate transporter [Thozetella sp. PMI_491]|nr:MFS general substrate transporter [Thozetella sp. PMI_491]